MKRILADTGPLVALLDSRDDDHGACVAAARELQGLLVTTWPVLTEAMFLLAPDNAAQDGLLGKVESGAIWIGMLDATDVAPLRALLHKYRDLPMDLADATLVHIGNRERIDTVFTLDSDFSVYRLRGGRTFSIIP